MPNAGALQSFSISRVSDGQVNLNWNKGSSNAERIYFSRWNQADGTWGGEFYVEATLAFGDQVTPRTDITSNRTYRYRARGWRSDGTTGFGPYLYSDYVQTTPRAPINQSAGLSGPNAISLSWSDGCYEPNYAYETQIWWNINGGGWGHFTTVAAGTGSYAFTGLTPGATYQFLVKHRETMGGLVSGDAVTGVVTALNVPAAPGAITATRNSDAQATLSWTNNSNSGAPYDSLTLQRWDNVGNAWATIANLGGTATTATDAGLVAGRKYQWRILANNAVGSSGWSYSGNVFTTPTAPSNVNAAYTGGTTVRATWTNNSSYSEYGVRIQAYKNGVADGAVVSLNGGTTLYDKTGVDATATYYFKVWAVSDTGALASSQAQSNSVQPAAPPGKPTGLAVSAPVVDLAKSFTISWQHTPSTDGSAQTKYQIQHRVQGAATWTVATAVTSSAMTINNPFTGYTNGQVIEWQVQTWGVHATGSGWSSSHLITTSTTPTVSVTGPSTTINTSVITVAWSYFDQESTAQAEWKVDLYETVSGNLVESKSGTGTTSSLTMDTKATDGLSYRAEVAVRDGSGLWSSKGVRSFTAAFTPPAPVGLIAELDGASGAGILELTTPPPLLTPGQVVATNYLTNPSFETNATGWLLAGASGVTLSRDTTVFDGGIASLKAVCDGAVAQQGMYYSPVAISELTAGGKFGAAVRVRTSVSLPLEIYAISQGTGNVDRILNVTTVGGAWETFTVLDATLGATKNPYLIVRTRAAAAGTIWVDSAIVFTGATSPGFFDGSTARDSDHYYEWTGTANASTSVKKQIGTLAPSGVTVERQFYDEETETWGEWEVLIENAPPSSRIIDTTAPAHDDGHYRITTLSSAPSSVRPATLYKPPPIDNRWLYVSGGPSFDVVCKMWANIEISQKASRSKALHYFAGRKNPVIYSGEAAERHFTISGILEDEASPPQQWIRLARQGGPVLLRAPGRRMYGSLSEVTVDRIQNGLHKVSFSIQEVSR